MNLRMELFEALIGMAIASDIKIPPHFIAAAGSGPRCYLDDKLGHNSALLHFCCLSIDFMYSPTENFLELHMQ